MKSHAVYSVQELAELLGVSDDTVRKGAREGWIPAVKLTSTTYVYPKAAVDAWLAMPGFQLSVLVRQMNGNQSPAQKIMAVELIGKFEKLLDQARMMLEDDPTETLRLVK